MIKSSKILDSLVDDIFDFDCDMVYELGAECFARENEDKCRTDHFNSHIRDGVSLVTKSLKTKKPIFCVTPDKSDVVLYFVNDLASLKKKFKLKFEEMSKLVLENEDEENEDEEIEELETKLQALKSKKKKK